MEKYIECVGNKKTGKAWFDYKDENGLHENFVAFEACLEFIKYAKNQVGLLYDFDEDEDYISILIYGREN